ncbi:MAG: hypothetical protein ACPGQL_04835 [Thermoplasmatota archaeon]
MKQWTLGLLLAVLLAPMPVVSAQASEATVLSTDGTGDVALLGPDGNEAGAAPAGMFAGVDMVDVGIWSEDEETLSLFATVANIESSSEFPFPGFDPDYDFFFTLGEQSYKVAVVTAFDNPLNGVFERSSEGFLQARAGEGFWRFIDRVEVEFDFTEERIVAHLPKELLVDENQALIAKGRELTDIFVIGQSGPSFIEIDPKLPTGTAIYGPYFADRVPDEGAVSYLVRTGAIFQQGDLFSTTLDPVRWTNGEATTLAYQVTVENRAAEEDLVAVSIEGADPSWTMAFSERVSVPAESRVNVTLLVSIPFVHQHGMLDNFNVVFESLEGDGRSSTQLGVYWPRIPQPAGHHDTLWLHSASFQGDPPFDTVFNGNYGWFNAADSTVDELDQGLPLAGTVVPPVAFAAFGGGTDGASYWSFPLSPALRMGLDFDLSRIGELTTAINLPVPALDPRVDAYLVLEDREQRNGGRFLGGNDGGDVETTVLANATVQLSGTLSGRQDLIMAFTPTPEADLIDYQVREGWERNLRLHVQMYSPTMTGAFYVPGALAPTTQPTIDPTATVIRLPLFEYHAPVDLTFVTDRAIELTVGDMGQDRRLNPGRSLVYEFNMAYTGEITDTFDLSLTGNNVHWAQILGDLQVKLQPGESRTLALKVTAPKDASPGEVGDVTLTATSRTNAAVQGGLRTLSTVVSVGDQDIADEASRADVLSGELTDEESTPVPLGVAVGALLVAVAVSARRLGRGL